MPIFAYLLKSFAQAESGQWLWQRWLKVRLLLIGVGFSFVLLAASLLSSPQSAFAQSAENGTATEPAVLNLDDKVQRLNLAGNAWVWIDQTKQADVAQAWGVFQQNSPESRLQLRGAGKLYELHEKAMWVHFKAHNLNASTSWKLQIDLPTTDQATLYYQRADGSWQMQQAGDAIAHHRWQIKDRYPLFTMSDQTAVPVSYLLRIAHQRVPYSADVWIGSDETVLVSRQAENLLLGGYFGLIIAIVVLCIANGIVQGYAHYFRYALYVAVLGIAQLSYLGLWTQYVTPAWVAWNLVASFVMPIMSVVLALWLVNALVQPAQYSRGIYFWALLVMLLLCVAALLETFAPTMLSFRAANALMIVGMATIFLMLWRSARLGDRNAYWIALGFLPVVLMGLVPTLRNFGLLSTGFITQYGVTIGSAIEVPLLMYALLRRSANQRDMRVREQALLQQDAITGLPDERRFVSKLHSSLLRARRYRHKLGLLHVRLQNHDQLAKEFGSQVANAALLLTASQLRSVSREIDLPARLPGHEFILLMEGPVTSARLIEAATQLLAHSLRPSEALPVGTQPRLMISVALLPDEQADSVSEDANTQYQWLLSQTESQNEDGPRKAIRAINF
jgi:two-component system, sensor histidine kinase LadS